MTRTLRIALLFLGLLALAACAGKEAVQTARAAVAASAAVYGTALDGFKIYNALPRCKVEPTPPCSDAAAALAIAQKLQVSRGAIDRARDMVNLLPGQGDAIPVTTLAAPQQATLTSAAAAAADVDTAVKSAKGSK